MGKKVLIISFHWPPSGNVGAIRPSKFAKYLPHFGWQPTILTAGGADHLEGSSEARTAIKDIFGEKRIQVIKTGYTDVLYSAKKIIGLSSFTPALEAEKEKNAPVKGFNAGIKSKLAGFAREFLTIPDEAIGWYRPAVKAGLNLLKNEKFHLIFSTSPPETSHLIARALKRGMDIPWVADLRDPWADYHQLDQRHFSKKLFLSWLENITLKDCAGITTVSEPLAIWFKKKYKNLFAASITNGFDEEDFSVSEQAKTNGFTFVYTGKIHKRKQNPELFFKAISSLIESGKITKDGLKIKFFSYGYHSPDFNALAEKYDLEKVFEKHDKIPNDEAIKEQQKASILLLFDWLDDSPVGRGVIPVKFFEYLGAKKPILLVNGNPRGALADLIEKTNSGFVASTESELKEILVRWAGEFSAMHNVQYQGRQDEIRNYTRRVSAEKLACLFSRLSGNNGGIKVHK